MDAAPLIGLAVATVAILSSQVATTRFFVSRVDRLCAKIDRVCAETDGLISRIDRRLLDT